MNKYERLFSFTQYLVEHPYHYYLVSLLHGAIEYHGIDTVKDCITNNYMLLISELEQLASNKRDPGAIYSLLFYIYKILTGEVL